MFRQQPTALKNLILNEKGNLVIVLRSVDPGRLPVGRARLPPPTFSDDRAPFR